MKKIVPFIFSFFLFDCTSPSNTTVIPEVYAEVPYAVGNIAYTHSGELVFSNHPFFDPATRVMHYNPNTKKTTPFPNQEWNTPKEDSEHFLSSVLGIRNDQEGIVWMLDMGFRNHITAKLVGWNTKTDSLEKIYYLPEPAVLPSSQPNDFVIDKKHNVFIIADEDIGPGGDGSHGALIVVNMENGEARRVLEGHYSTIPENKPIIFNNKNLNIPDTDKPILVGADGITADQDNEWLYYAPLSGTRVYRIPISDLINSKLSDKELDKKVEVYANKENNGGLSIDKSGNLYLTYIETNSIGIIPKGSKKSYNYTYHKDMVWPDGVSYNKDGYMYASAAQLPLAGVFNGGQDKTKKPFQIFRFKPLAEGLIGR